MKFKTVEQHNKEINKRGWKIIMKCQIIDKSTDKFCGLIIDDIRRIVWAVVAEIDEEIEISDSTFWFKGDYIYQQNFPINKIVKARNWCHKMYKRVNWWIVGCVTKIHKDHKQEYLKEEG